MEVRAPHLQLEEDIMNIMEIKSINEIAAFLRKQADLRAPENDEGGILQDLADELTERVADLEK